MMMPDQDEFMRDIAISTCASLAVIRLAAGAAESADDSNAG